MNQPKQAAESRQTQWAQFRFSIIGALLSSPPNKGELKRRLETLSQQTWRHPIHGTWVRWSVATLERWYYKARRAQNPIETLRIQSRSDAAHSRKMTSALKERLREQYHQHPSWSYQLHYDNVKALATSEPAIGELPTYHTVRRYLKANGWCKRKKIHARDTAGAFLAQQRLETREIRSFEMDYVHSLWHLDYHHGSRKILDATGQWRKPYLLAILDDRSRLICHAQWYLSEGAETLVHGLIQALEKRGLPRALMSDNGSAMMSEEFTQGLARLSILHQPTLPYSPYQNAKQEVFWAQVEGRLMAMLEGEGECSLALLNQATLAWIELDYHRKFHGEIQNTPLGRYVSDKQVGRDCPAREVLRKAFCRQVKRRQRHSDGTFVLEGKRFEVPNAYRHLSEVCVRYARWDLSSVYLVDAKQDNCIQMVYPQDKSANAQRTRRELIEPKIIPTPLPHAGMAPLLKKLMADYAATGLPPAYIPGSGEEV